MSHKDTIAAEMLSKRALECVRRARTAMILDEPFFGTLAALLALVEDTSCDTMWTDGVSVGYNPTYVTTISQLELKGVFAHEVMHCVAGHPWRRDNRDPEDWNEAADYAINPIVKDANFHLPDNVLFDAAYRGLSSETIYSRLAQKKDKSQDKSQSPSPGSKPEPGKAGSAGGDKSQQDKSKPGQDPNGKDADKSKAQPGSNAAAKQGKPQAGEVRDAPAGVNKDQLAQQWKIATEQAALVAKSRGNLPGSLQELIDDNKKSVIDWKEALWQFVQTSFVSPDYQWKTPNRRYMGLGLYLPSLIGEQMPPMVVARDTSFSVPREMLEQAYAELKEIEDKMKPKVIYAIDADTRITNVLEIHPGDEFKLDAKGRGGTDFRPVFDWVEKEGIQPCCLIYITDMDGPFPKTEPDYPVLWITPPKAPKAPWGMQIEMPV